MDRDLLKEGVKFLETYTLEELLEFNNYEAEDVFETLVDEGFIRKLPPEPLDFSE